MDLGVDMDIIAKSGSWFSFGGNKLGQGKEAVRQHLESNPTLCEEIENLIHAKAAGGAAVNKQETPQEVPA